MIGHRQHGLDELFLLLLHEGLHVIAEKHCEDAVERDEATMRGIFRPVIEEIRRLQNLEDNDAK